MRQRGAPTPRAAIAYCAVADDEEPGAHEPGVDRDVDEGDGDDQVGDAGAERAGDPHRQDEPGEGGDHVHDAHRDLVGLAAEIAGERPDRRPEDEPDGDRAEADAEVDAGAVEDAGEDVLAEDAGAERVRPATAPAIWRGSSA